LSLSIQYTYKPLFYLRFLLQQHTLPLSFAASLSGLPIGTSQRPAHGGGALASVSTRPETVAAIDAAVESVAKRVETLTGIPDDHGMAHQLLVSLLCACARK
jgi:hypothetical protein